MKLTSSGRTQSAAMMQVALVFPILIVHDHGHLAALQVVENFIDRIELCHGSLRLPFWP